MAIVGRKHGAIMQLTEKPETVTWPQTHYVFIEKIGPFKDTAPQAWQDLHRLLPEIPKENEIQKYFALYKVPQQIYRAGVSLAAPPKNLPSGLAYEVFPGGKYNKFVLTGSWSNLPQASGKVFEMVSQQKLHVREDFNIEHYLNTTRDTPEEKLVTEILIPTA
jgi:predicted transcriptional regulator YdeE